MQDAILGIVRHLLTSAGGALVAKGIATSASVDQGVGALITLAGLIWSIVDKLKSKPAAK